MITRIVNFSRKSFKQYSMPESLEFKTQNVIFGYNGKGKSSLCEGLKEEISKNPDYNESNIKLYNNSYMQLYLVNNDNNRLKGIKALFGEKNNKVENSIKELEKQLIDVTKLEAELNTIAKNIDLLVAQLEDDIRGKTRLKHNSFNSLSDIKTFKDAFYSNYQASLKIINDKDLDGFNSDVDFESKRQQLMSFSVPILPNFTKEDWGHIGSILLKEYSNENIPTADLLEWINRGLVLHNDNTGVCKFCGSSNIDLDRIKNELNSFLENTKTIDKKVIDDFNLKIIEGMDDVKRFILDEKLRLIADDPNFLINKISSLIDNIDSLVVKINEKTEKFEKFIIDVDIDEFFAYWSEIQNILNQINELKLKRLTEIDKQEKKINDILKGAIAKKVLNSSKINEQFVEFNKKNKEISNANKINAGIDTKIRDLKNSMSVFGGFASFINDILDHLDVKFNLECVDQDYRIIPKNDKTEISLADISEGEKNLISLMFYYFSLFENEKLETLSGNIKYLILDDPISSLDDNNRSYIISIIKEILKIQNVQIFVLTHNWDDFCSIAYHLDKKNTGLFEVYKNNQGKSELRKTKTTISPYEHDFIELLRAKDISSDTDLNESDIYHLPNCIRRVLEYFLRFKSCNSNPTASNFECIKEVLLVDDTTKTRHSLELAALLNVVNEKSHVASRSPGDVLKAVKFLLSRIERVDNAHYKMMKSKKASFDQMS